MATNTVDQTRLVMNAFAATFQNNLIASDLVTWRQYDGEYNERNGLQVSEQIPPRYTVNSTTDGVADLTSGVQDSVFGSEMFKINKTFNTSMGWGDFVKIRDIGSARESEALKAAATQLAETIDAYILGVAVKASNNWVGTADGVTVAGHDDVARAYTRLKEEGVSDEDLRLVLSYQDREALSGTIIAYPSTDSMATSNFRKGFEGEINGIPTVFTQQLPALTVGSRAASGAALINGASQNANYKDVAISTTPGYFMTDTIAIDGLTGSQTIKDGEVFTIAGVYAWDNRAQVTTGRLQQFRVVGDATATTGAIAALRIFPAMIVPGSGSGGDILVNTAHATVDAAPADNAAITFVGTASTAYRPRALIQKQSIIVNTATLPAPMTGTMGTKALTKVPLSVRMWQHSDFATGAHSVRFDVALTANVRERRRIVRLNGVA
jgi:hypothetical protein